MASAVFEIWIDGRYRTRFRNNASPDDEEACMALLKSQAKRYRAKASNVELKVRHHGRTEVYRGS